MRDTVHWRSGSTFALTALLVGACDPLQRPAAQQQEALLGVCIGLVAPSCCTDDECNDDNDCTVDQCNGAVIDLVAGTCTHTPVNDPLCCNSVNDCTAITGCGTPTCQAHGNTWKDCAVVSGSQACCQTVADCPTVTCNSVLCTANVCVYTGTPTATGCCSTADDCTDDTMCRSETCVDSQCVPTPVRASGCCTDVNDCAPNFCQAAHCQDNACIYTGREGTECCNSDSDCNQTGSCGHAACVDNVCTPRSGCDMGTADAVERGADAALSPSLSGGGGCSMAGTAQHESTVFWLLVISAFLALRARPRLA